MLLWSQLALATSICVPQAFQHWTCDTAAATVDEAVQIAAGSAGEDTVHIHWDHEEATGLDVTQAIDLRGHPGPAGELPRLREVDVSASGDARLANLELYATGTAHALRVRGSAIVTAEDLRILVTTAADNEPAVQVQGSGQLLGTRVEVDGSGSVSTEHGALLRAFETAVVECTGCTLHHALAGQGAIRVEDNADVVLIGGSLESNAAQRGGAAFVKGNGYFRAQGVRFLDNSAATDGGAVYAESGVVEVAGATFCSNASGDQGGAVHAAAGTLSSHHNIYWQNTSVNGGAAAFAGSTASLTSHQDSYAGNQGSPDDGLHGPPATSLLVEGALFVGHDDKVVYDGDEVDHSFFGADVLGANAPAAHVNNTVLGTNVFGGSDPITGSLCDPRSFVMSCDETEEAATSSWLNQGMGARLACAAADDDGDGLMLHEEQARGTDAGSIDSDGDGLTDLQECPRGRSSALNNPSFEPAAGVLLNGGLNAVAEQDVPGWFLIGGTGDIELAGVDTYGSLPVPAGAYGLRTSADIVRQGFDAVAGERVVLELTATNKSFVSKQLHITFDYLDTLETHDFNISAQAEERIRIAHEIPEGVVAGGVELSGEQVLVDAVYFGPEADTDADGIPDCLDSDSDDDGVADADEVAIGSDTTVVDSDGDGLDDAVDPAPLDADVDQDDLDDSFEGALGLDTGEPDTDGDGVPDAEECPDAGLVNGGFEARRGSILTDDATLSPLELHGWAASSDVVVRLGGSGETPPASQGSFVLDLGETGSIQQEVEVDPGVPLTLLLDQRGRFAADTVELTVSGGTTLVSQTLSADDLSWVTHTIDFVPDADIIEVLLTQVGSGGSYLDAGALLPQYAFGTNDLLCLDALEQPVFDADGDGFDAGVDCDDTDPHVFPGAVELCDAIDDDCDGEIDEGLPTNTFFNDGDGDGWGTALSIESCAAVPPVGYATETGDCDDDNAAIAPGAMEVCDGVDNDCDGQPDEGLPTNTFFVDHDDDTYGDPLEQVVSCSPTPPTGSVTNALDCNDADAAVNPDGIETCNGVDDDCNGTVDNGLPTSTYFSDNDGDGFGASPPVSSCQDTPPPGTSSSSDDCDDSRHDVYPGAHELCDPVDHDCDGNTQTGALDAAPFYLDQDEDGFGADATVVLLCSPPPGYVPDGGDCSDTNDAVSPDADETCNDVDDDCDGQVDEEAIDVQTFYLDADNDQFGITDSTIQACDRPQGYAAVDEDCDDDVGTVYPGAPELCDGLDNDCDGLFDADEAIEYVDFYEDADGDGYGDQAGIPVNDCMPLAGRVANNLDCDDGDVTLNPATVETCDGIDSNCSGDESDATDPELFFDDVDGDGWGDASAPVFACEQPSGTVTNSGDCDDDAATNMPGGIEVCDGLDNNCNGIVDSDAETAPIWYQDTDDDGYGVSGSVVSFCTQPPFYTDVAGDCDDGDALVYPDAPELCDGLDNDCDGLVDFDDPDGPQGVTWYPDGDGDGFGDGAALEACEQPSGYAGADGDCDDDDDDVYPGAPEACDGVDANCDGVAGSQQGYLDLDGDGYGDAGSEPACDDQPRVSDGTDCDDGNALVNPGALERCDNTIDDDCDGLIFEDEGFLDDDADGYGISVRVCGGATVDGDCDDDDAAINPGAVEIAGDGVDQDCDGIEPRSIRFGPVCATGPVGAGWLPLLGLLFLRRRGARRP